MVVLVVALTGAIAFGQNPSSRSIPYMTSVFAGTPGQSTAANPYNVGQGCPSGGGKIAMDIYGDGCLATEAVLSTPYAVVFDSAGNAYVADYDPAGFSFVRKIDAVTGVISMFAGGMSGTSSAYNGPCAGYIDGPDPAVTNLPAGSNGSAATVIQNIYNGDGCPAEDPVTGQSYSYFKGIRDLAIDANYLYIDDSSNSRIRKVGLSNSPVDQYHLYAHEVEPVAGLFGANGFGVSTGWGQDGPVNGVTIKNPYAVAVDSVGNVFFGDQSGNSIRRVTPTTYSFVNGAVVGTVGVMTTVLNCAASGSVCRLPVNNGTPACPAVENPAGASRNIGTYSVTGMAFDASGNLYYAASHCYSFYKIAANSSGLIDGSTPVTMLLGAGASGTNTHGNWIPAFSSTPLPLSGARSITSAGGNNMYLFNGNTAWFYDAANTVNDATSGWIHAFWNSTSLVGQGCQAVGTTTYYGCPAPYSSFSGGSTGGKGMMDAHGNLYIADGGDNLILKAANGLDLAGFGPTVQVNGGQSLTNAVLIHGGDITPISNLIAGISNAAETNAAIASADPFFTLGVPVPLPFSQNFLNDSACLQYNSAVNETDDAIDCVLALTYTPIAAGPQTGTLVINGGAENLPIYAYGAGSFTTPVWANVSCMDKIYDGTTNEPISACSCALTAGTSPGGAAIPPNLVSCAGTVASFSQANAGYGIPVTVMGISLSGSSAGEFSLSNSVATTTATIDKATPYVTVNCPIIFYGGVLPSCTVMATGVNGMPVAGYLSCGGYPGPIPGPIWPYPGPVPVVVGGYSEVCTFVSLDPNYNNVSVVVPIGINPIPPMPIPPPFCRFPYDGQAHRCIFPIPLGISGNAVNGSWGCNTQSAVNAGVYSLMCTFTSLDPNYTSETSSGTLEIDPATPTMTVNCPSVVYDGNAHSCTATATGVSGAAVSGSSLFTPGSETTVGSYPETANFTSADSNYTNASGSGTLVINESLTGTVGAMFGAAQVVFPNAIMMGQSSPAQYLSLMSTGTAPLLVTSVTVGGANPGDFAISNQAGSCITGTSLVYHASCNLRVIFTPKALGTRSAILYFNYNLAGSPTPLPVSGTAISGAQLTLSVGTLTFPATAVGATAATQYLTLKSTGYQPVVISTVTLASSDFDLSDQAGTCTTAATTSLVPGASCNIRVRFHPAATGSRTAQVVINDNTPASPHSVTLNGTGQ
jgi:hypothetical protein